MKTGTQNHVKTKRLKRLLGVPLYQAVGILETMWQLCMEVCEEGNIGKFTDEEIADYLEWDGEASKLVTALADAGWLDRDAQHRYIVHDWLEECPEFIWDRIRKRKQREQRVLNRREIKTYVSSASDISEDVRAGVGRCRDIPGVPNPTQPNHIKTNPPTPLPPEAPADGGRAGGDEVLDSGEAIRTYRPPDDLEAANAELLTLAKSPPRLAPAGWGAVADALTGMGASQWRKAISEAKECGCDADLALSLVEHGKRKGYGVGAIICRLSKARPTLAIDVGWPKLEAIDEAAKQAAMSRAEKDRRTAAADKIIIAMRKCQQSDDAIRAALKAKGLEWPQ